MSLHHEAELLQGIFDHPQHARDLLQSLLPTDVAADLDLERAALTATHLTGDELEELCTDLLYAVPRRAGGEALVYLLFGPAIASDPWLSVHVLKRQLRIWEAWRTEHPDATGPPPFHPVIVNYGGES